MVNAENLSAQEASAQQGAWLPQENVYEEWPQGAGSPSCEGPQAADPVIFAHSAAQKKKQIEPPSMSGSFFYVVHAGGSYFFGLPHPRPGASDTRTLFQTLLETLERRQAGRAGQYICLSGFGAAGARPGIGPLPSHKKARTLLTFGSKTHEENLCDQTKP